MFVGLFSLNFVFQGFGTSAVVKMNSAWYLPLERGTFSGIYNVRPALSTSSLACHTTRPSLCRSDTHPSARPPARPPTCLPARLPAPVPACHALPVCLPLFSVSMSMCPLVLMRAFMTACASACLPAKRAGWCVVGSVADY